MSGWYTACKDCSALFFWVIFFRDALPKPGKVNFYGSLRVGLALLRCFNCGWMVKKPDVHLSLSACFGFIGARKPPSRPLPPGILAMDSPQLDACSR
jgi:hypothetical protein